MEEITLGKIDELRERTGLSYREAKELLEKSNGNVLDACIEWESNRPNIKDMFDLKDLKGQFKEKKEDILKRLDDSKIPEKFNDFKISAVDKAGRALELVKKIVKEGNVNKIRVKHDNKVIAEVPIALGALAAVILPELAVVGVLVASFKSCTIELVKKDGTVTNINTEKGTEE